MIKALIFDFDGLIIDSESPEFQVWQEVFAEHGRELGFDLWADLIGRPRTHFDVYAYFCENINPAADIEQLRKDRRARVVALTLEQPVLPGVYDYLRGALDLGLKIGLASSSSGDHVDRVRRLAQRRDCGKGGWHLLRRHTQSDHLPVAARTRGLPHGVDGP